MTKFLYYTPPYLTRIEGPPPKRNVVRSSRAGGARCLAHSGQGIFSVLKITPPFIYTRLLMWYDHPSQKTEPNHPATQCANSVSCLRDDSRLVCAGTHPACIRERPGRIRSGIRALRHAARYDGNVVPPQRCGVVPIIRRKTQNVCRRNNRRPRAGGRIRTSPDRSSGTGGLKPASAASGTTNQSGFHCPLNRRYKTDKHTGSRMESGFARRVHFMQRSALRGISKKLTAG